MVSWAVLGFAFLQLYLGELLGFPDWLSALSPYFHLPQQPLESFALAPEFGVLGVAAALAAAGILGLRRRDITA